MTRAVVRNMVNLSIDVSTVSIPFRGLIDPFSSGEGDRMGGNGESFSYVVMCSGGVVIERMRSKESYCYFLASGKAYLDACRIILYT